MSNSSQEPGPAAPFYTQPHSRYISTAASVGDSKQVQPTRDAPGTSAAADMEQGGDSSYKETYDNGKPSQGGRKPWRFQILGLDPSPEVAAIAMVYFVQGILGLSRLAVSFYFKDELHIEPAEVAVLTGVATIPWMIKPLYGFISDTIPLFGYRRRSYLALCGLLGCTAWTVLATVVDSPSGTVACMVLASLSTAASDVVVDSIVVERARGHPQAVAGSLQSLCWASQSLGGIISAYFSGSLVQDFGCRFVFGVTALFPLVVSCTSMLINEKPAQLVATPTLLGNSSTPVAAAPLVLPAHTSSSISHRHSRGRYGDVLPGTEGDAEGPDAENPLAPLMPRSRSKGGTNVSPLLLGPAGGVPLPIPPSLVAQFKFQLVTLWSAVRRKEIFLPTLFIFLWQSTPSADSAMFYFYTNQLGFQPEFLGRVRLAHYIASLVGVFVYNTTLKRVPLRQVLWWSMWLGVALGSTQLILITGLNRTWGLSDQLFVLGDSVMLTVLGQISFMPIMVLAARLCPEGVEATLFATLMSILNAGGVLGGALGAGLTSAYGVSSTDFSRLAALSATCTVLMLAPAPFLSLLPKELDTQPSEDKEAQPQGQGEGQGGGDDGGRKESLQQQVELTEGSHGHAGPSSALHSSGHRGDDGGAGPQAQSHMRLSGKEVDDERGNKAGGSSSSGDGPKR